MAAPGVDGWEALEGGSGSGCCCGGTVTVVCCDAPVPQTLHASLDAPDCPCLDGLVIALVHGFMGGDGWGADFSACNSVIRILFFCLDNRPFGGSLVWHCSIESVGGTCGLALRFQNNLLGTLDCTALDQVFGGDGSGWTIVLSGTGCPGDCGGILTLTVTL